MASVRDNVDTDLLAIATRMQTRLLTKAKRIDSAVKAYKDAPSKDTQEILQVALIRI